MQIVDFFCYDDDDGGFRFLGRSSSGFPTWILRRFSALSPSLSLSLSPVLGPVQEEAAAIRAAGKSWYQTMISDSDYTEFENFSKWLGVTQ